MSPFLSDPDLLASTPETTEQCAPASFAKIFILSLYTRHILIFFCFSIFTSFLFHFAVEFFVVVVFFGGLQLSVGLEIRRRKRQNLQSAKPAPDHARSRSQVEKVGRHLKTSRNFVLFVKWSPPHRESIEQQNRIRQVRKRERESQYYSDEKSPIHTCDPSRHFRAVNDDKNLFMSIEKEQTRASWYFLKSAFWKYLYVIRHCYFSFFLLLKYAVGKHTKTFRCHQSFWG